MPEVFTLKINDDFQIIEDPDIILNFELEEEVMHFVIVPQILSVSFLYREALDKICKKVQKAIKDGANIKPIFIFSSLNYLDSIEGLTNSNFEERIVRFLKNKNYSSFLFNSSVWIYYVEIEFLNNKINIDKTKQNYNNSLLRLKNNQHINPFKKSNAIEYIEYHLRVQSENYLEDKSKTSTSSGHGRYITPILYSNELKLRSEIALAPDLKFFYPDIRDNKDKPIRGIVLRILLIDDKISVEEKTTGECKAELINKLLMLEIEDNECEANESIFNNVCWLIQKGERDSVTIKSFDKFESNRKSDNYTPRVINDLNKAKIQIIAVKNLDIARQLLACDEIHFDLIMMDYLLDWKKDKPDEREYATEFWGDGNEKYFEFSKDFSGKKYTKEQIDNYTKLMPTYNKIKSNRGPMQRLWIFPITAFNQTFIDDLRNKGVRLIDYYWYLSRGADPINTPYLFIYTLNKFLQLQIESAIFSKIEIFGFLRKSIQRLDLVTSFDGFSAFMGSEYTVFVDKYMTRPVIYRDKEAGSLFAKYVWDNFFANPDFESLFRLTNQVHKFYHRCAFGTLADFEKMLLFWRELRIFIEEKFYNESRTEGVDIDKFYEKLKELADRP